MATSDRDPRIDPQFGDQVTVGDETREVELSDGLRVIYSWPGTVAVRSLSLTAWRTWAAAATAWVPHEAKPAVA